uniref:Conopressin n=1 Tax=Charonia tritonis TaxID=1960912 RepID=A0A1S6JQ07_9CAEN|nr:Conopressin precursor [Charonia tritonis]
MQGYGMKFSVVPVVLFMLLASSYGCFIRNCPRGGKRAFDGGKPCMPCGPDGAGQCVGPAVCCGKSFGCLVGTREARECEKENESSTACSVQGRQCGRDNSGRCVAKGICCVADACSFNERCAEIERNGRDELLGLIRRLLVTHQYE